MPLRGDGGGNPNQRFSIKKNGKRGCADQPFGHWPRWMPQPVALPPPALPCIVCPAGAPQGAFRAWTHLFLHYGAEAIDSRPPLGAASGPGYGLWWGCGYGSRPFRGWLCGGVMTGLAKHKEPNAHVATHKNKKQYYTSDMHVPMHRSRAIARRQANRQQAHLTSSQARNHLNANRKHMMSGQVGETPW